MSDPNDLFIFLHVPKTGGTTFNGHCLKHLELNRQFVHFGPFGRKAERAAGLPSFAKRDVTLRQQARVLAGHRTYIGIHDLVPDRRPRYLMFLRRPATRLVSKYNGFMTRKKNAGNERTFEAWYRDEPRNEITRLCNQFGGRPDAKDDTDSAREILERLWFVGLTERLDDSLRFVFGKIGIPTDFERLKVTGRQRSGPLPRMDREIPRLISLSDALRDRLDLENRADVALYQHARRLHERRLAARC